MDPSFYIDIDSKDRFISTENPCNFTIFSDQTKNWPSVLQYLNNNVMIEDLFIKYDNIQPEPFVKIDFHHIEYNDPGLINSLDSNQVNFISKLDKLYQSGWYNYKTTIVQTMRMPKKGSYKLIIYDKDNNILDVGTDGRIHIIVSISNVKI